jgi:cell fate regulator YaaT (PSP1 superfamily)
MYIGVKFREQGQIYYFEAAQEDLTPGDHVIVTTEEGQGIGRVALVDTGQPENLTQEEIKTIDRKADEEDLARLEENRDLARNSFAYCREQIKQKGLEMKLVDVEVRFDQSKFVFYFTAPNRVDFRELVKDLVNQYKARIELRQIGVRHEAQILGGVGNCGRICCCHQFMREFVPVTIKMAKEQQLFLNPSKISGVCGRLLCCLNFEKKAYADFYSRCPKIGRKYSTSLGEVKVLRANFFRDTLVVDAGEGEEREINLLEWGELLSGVTEECATQESDVEDSSPPAPEELATEGAEEAPDPESSDSGEAKTGEESGQQQKGKPSGGSGQRKKGRRSRGKRRGGSRSGGKGKSGGQKQASSDGGKSGAQGKKQNKSGR